MAKNDSTISFSEGDLHRKILKYIWPVMFSELVNQIYRLTNSLIVGNFISKDALSAVAATSIATGFYDYVFSGMGNGAGVCAGRFFGAKDYRKLRSTIETCLLLTVIGGFVLTIGSELLIPVILKLMNINDSIYSIADSYLRMYMLSIIPSLGYQVCFFILRSLGDTKHPLFYLIISCCLNLVFGVVFVRGFNMGADGTALATIISKSVVCILCARLFYKQDERYRLTSFRLKFDGHVAEKVFEIGIPQTFQNVLMNISNFMIQSYTNTFSNDAIAGMGVAQSAQIFVTVPCMSITNVSINAVSQNYGAEEYERCQETVKYTNKLVTISTAAVGTLVFIFAPGCIRLFNADPMVVKYGSAMLRWIVYGQIFLGWSHIYNGACRALGNARVPLFIGALTQCFGKLLFVVIGLKIKYCEQVIYMGNLFGSVTAGIGAALYFRLSPWTKEKHLR